MASVDVLKKELETLKLENNFDEPDRGNLDDESIKWRHGKPSYVKANLEFLKGKTMNHSADSLERLVENLVKTWEMEASHKIDFSQWKTIDHENYSICGNAGKVFKGLEAFEKGNYNSLMDCCPKDLYDSDKETFDSSHDLFRNSFTDGFPWELIRVFSGPPKVTFTWRHWGKFNGEFRGNKGNNEIIEMYGIAQVTVTKDLKVQNIEIFYGPNEFLQVLEGKRPHEELQRGKALVGSGCPFLASKK